MTTAHDIAIELRKMADSLDKEPEAALTKAYVWMNFSLDKAGFINAARLLPRPAKKRFDEEGRTIDRIHLEYDTPHLEVSASMYRDQFCKILVPAKVIPAIYECEPLLSAEEEASLEVQP
jgi:hypothetical protein